MSDEQVSTTPSPADFRVSITSTFEIAAAHHLPHHQGKCKRHHGHNYRLVFTRYGWPKPAPQAFILDEQGQAIHYSDEGMVMDFGDLDEQIKRVLARLDHHTLNDLPGLENPTAEHLALWLLQQLPLVDRVEVWETGRHSAVAERDERFRALSDAEQAALRLQLGSGTHR